MSVPFSTWFVLAIIAIIAILVVVGVIFLASNSASSDDTSASTISELIAKYKNPNTWGASAAGPDPNRNVCRLYTFPGSIGPDGVARPGQATFARPAIDALTPQDPPPCTDSDQVVVSQRQHTCQGDTGQASFCVRYDGTRATPGEVEVYYDNSKCATTACIGTLGLVGLSGLSTDISPTPIDRCIEMTPVSGQLQATLQPCDLTKSTQLFRVTRKNFGAPEPSADSNTTAGPLGRIVYRENGLCLAPGPSVGFSGPPLILVPCTPDTDYIWGFVPQMITSTRTIPQRIAYVKGRNPADIPLTDPNAFVDYASRTALPVMSGILNSTTNRVTFNSYGDTADPATNGSLNNARFYNYFLYNANGGQGTPF